MDYQSFVNGHKTLLIAPAGYGKTFTIAEALKHTIGKQLILTHTHAGIISIREKIKDNKIPQNKYSIETISSFAQKYFHAFYVGKDIPDQESKEYHSFIIEKATSIFSCQTVKLIISKTYNGLFVDEYQDCTKPQHNFITAIADVLPTHILGDPLQAIFDFNGDAVDFERDLLGYQKFPDLSVPHRWYKDESNKNLGDKLKELRDILLRKEDILLSSDDKIKFHVIDIVDGDLNQSIDYRNKLKKIILNAKNLPDLESLLIIVPEYEEVKENGQKINKGDINHRAKIRSQIDYSKKLILLEAIDGKMFYSIAKDVDNLLSKIRNATKKINLVKSVLTKLFNKTEFDDWFNANGFKAKRNQQDHDRTQKVRQAFDIFFKQPSAYHFLQLMLETKKEFKLKYKRDEVLRSLISALKRSQLDNISVYDAMKSNRNHIRRCGRKIHGKCIGTTLLTKGLEFDTVVILDAHKFECPRNLYVALTRCCKRLIIFTANKVLSPYPER